MEEETKKPCTPVEEAGRDYNELGLYLHSKENNRTLEAAQTLWEFLPGWMAARQAALFFTLLLRPAQTQDIFYNGR